MSCSKILQVDGGGDVAVVYTAAEVTRTEMENRTSSDLEYCIMGPTQES